MLRDEWAASKHLYKEVTILTRDHERYEAQKDIESSHQETKNWLLKEVLTKWNQEVEEMEKGNK